VKYLLDTSTVSDYFRRVGNVVAAMHAVPPHQLAVSAITEHEMRYSVVLRSGATTLARKVDSFLRVIQVLPFDSEDATAAAAIRAVLDKTGRTIGPYDALIGGAALARKLTLVTSNEDEFERISALELECWR
jgi:tRNA(fMet)-specific endonuclease VapC